MPTGLLRVEIFEQFAITVRRALLKRSPTFRAGISVLAPNNPTLYIPLENQRTNIFSGRARAQDAVPSGPIRVPQTADHGLSIRSCQTPLRPCWLWSDLPATTSAIPLGATAPQSAAPYS